MSTSPVRGHGGYGSSPGPWSARAHCAPRSLRLFTKNKAPSRYCGGALPSVRNLAVRGRECRGLCGATQAQPMEVALSIALTKTLQRVVLASPSAPGSTISSDGPQLTRELPQRIHAVLVVIFDQALDSSLHMPISLFVEEIARRCKKKIRSVQGALKDALELGLIKRKRVDSGRNQRALPWLIWPHDDLSDAAASRTPWGGPELRFPRAWAVTAAEMQAPVTKHAGAFSAGKKEKKRTSLPRLALVVGAVLPAAQHGPQAEALPSSSPSPSGSFPNAVPPSGGAPAGGARARDKANPSEELRLVNLGSGLTSRAASMGALSAWSSGSRSRTASVGQRAAGAQAPAVLGDDQRFWDWFAASAAAAGWLEKSAGSWPGARAGDVEFSMQRRRLETNHRGPPLARSVVSISGAHAGAAAILRKAARWTRGPYEAIFYCKGANPLLIVDDAKPEHLHVLAGWNGVAVLETSPRNLQISLMAPRCLYPAELLAANRALADMFGLKREAVSSTQPRRFIGSVNNKKSLSEPFVTGLHCPLTDGTVSEAQLSMLLAGTTPNRVSGSAPTKTPEPRIEKADGGVDHSAEDWRFVMHEMEKKGGMRQVRLIDELTARCVSRARKGRAANDPEHRAYSERTVKRAVQTVDERRAAKAAVSVVRKAV